MITQGLSQNCKCNFFLFSPFSPQFLKISLQNIMARKALEFQKKNHSPSRSLQAMNSDTKRLQLQWVEIGDLWSSSAQRQTLNIEAEWARIDRQAIKQVQSNILKNCSNCSYFQLWINNQRVPRIRNSLRSSVVGNKVS